MAMTIVNDKKPRILIIDDDSEVRKVLLDVLLERYECAEADSAEEALDRLREEKFDLVLSDIMMGGMSGLEMLPYLLKVAPDTVVLIMSGERTIDGAIEAMQAGAFDYIMKPFDLRYVEAVVGRALDYKSLRESKRLYELRLEELVKQQAAERDYLTNHDTLTGLPNGALFEGRLNQSLIRAQRDERKLAVLLVALDRFKKFNDTLGHAVADKLLGDVAAKIISCVSPIDTVARFGSDEFALLLTQIADAEDVTERALKLREVFETPIGLDGKDLYITTSIGIAIFPDDGSDAQTLLKNASVALFRAKLQGGNNYQYYTADMNARALKRLSLESALRQALRREEFTIHYQPQVDLVSSSIVGAEALLRWQHLQFGLVPPAEFIPLAEDTGLIVSIGAWTLRAACLQNRSWREAGFGGLSVAVNLSPRQFRQPDLVQMVAGVIAETSIEPYLLQLELTESSIMEDTERAIVTLHELKEMGIKIALDDFGSGYSALSYLKRLPLDVLKIDSLFVRDITTGPRDYAIVLAIITLAHNLGLKVIAEGVETEEQLEALRALGCDGVQGYFFEPMPTKEFIRYLTAALT